MYAGTDGDNTEIQIIGNTLLKKWLLLAGAVLFAAIIFSQEA